MKRSEGERVRITGHIEILRALLLGLESCIEGGCPTSANAQSVAEAAIRVATSCAKLDAYEFAEKDHEIK